MDAGEWVQIGEWANPRMIPDESNLKWIKNTPNDQSITDQQSFTFNEVRGSGDAELINIADYALLQCWK